ncbi:PDZ domain-containing protein [Thiohalocapsa sp. ML1]|jgi:hypothetical protein|uniref:PDZ domain-containing protein n=1 Tax=Thiohalocapsa sp. ML1 TaxID=1431688 RepID=UPI0007322051|nr:PDZ domain-containing protein [Thiohalocapsa sp. ML1]
MQPRTRLIITYAATFLAGLLTGATVLSDVLRPPPESPPAPAPTAAVPAEPPLNIASVETAPPAPAEPPAPEPTPVAPPPATPAVSPEVTDELAERISELSNGWGRMQAELAELRHRVALVEQREPAGDSTAATEPRRRGPATPAEQRDALLRAGVTPELADDLLWRRSQVALARLELRDEAAREGWLGTARYREEIGRLNEEQVSIEDEVGSDAYDRYLFATGQPNRVAVDSVLPGSAGEESGLMTGDVIERYGDTPVLDFEDLRAATSTGVRGELVPVSVVRAGQRMEVWLPRGPIGIGLDATRLDPNG